MSLSRDEQALCALLELAPMAAQVETWANVNSGSGNLDGLATMAIMLGDAFAALGGEATLVEPQPVETVQADGELRSLSCGRHLVVRVRPEAPRQMLLTGHMDTVYPGDSRFQTCRWIDADTLQGPGTADMKGGIAVMLGALRALESSGLEFGYDVLINSDEEIGSPSSADLVAELAQGKLAALTYEPALPDGGLARARPGSGNFSAVVRGRAAHSGRNPQEGRNALVAAADLALRLARSARKGLLVNPARIDGGGPSNVVPALAIVRFNIRPRTPEDQREAEVLIAQTIAAVQRKHEVTIELHASFGRPPKPIDAASERIFQLIARTAQDLGETLHWADAGGVCDGNNIAACGVPVIDTMGPVGGAIHSPGEFLKVSSLLTRARVSAVVLHRLASEGLPQ